MTHDVLCRKSHWGKMACLMLASMIIAVAAMTALIADRAWGQECEYANASCHLEDVGLLATQADSNTEVWVDMFGTYHFDSFHAVQITQSQYSYYRNMGYSIPYKNPTKSTYGNAVRMGYKRCSSCRESSSSKPKPSPAPSKADDDLAAFAGAANAAGFTDLDPDGWYMNDGGKFPGTDTLYLDYTIGRKLMSGYAGTTLFGPNDGLTRGMAATIIYRMATGATAEDTDNGVSMKFGDVKAGAWYAAAVKWCADEGVVTGYTDGSGRFGPDDPITREQLATIIGRYMDKGKAAGEDVSQFKDEKSISGYARAGIAYCSANGIMTGVGDTGNFDPKGLATRCQMSKVIAVTARKAK